VQGCIDRGCHIAWTSETNDDQLFASKYQMTDHCLGHGAEAVVCLANDVQTGKQLVCKLVNLYKIHGKNAQDDIRRKFQEADILRQLHHPNILSYVDAISSPHTLYTFTELASGGDLMSFIMRRGTVKESESIIIIRQVARALAYLHEKGIVHRDIKPENILLAYSPKIMYHRVMLSDFGTSAVPRRSRMITNAGTTGYQAPEFVTTGEAHTAAVDIWSLGVVAFTLLVSDHHDTMLNQMDQVEIRQYVRRTLGHLTKRPSVDAAKFVQSCLKLNPLRRMSAREAKRHEWLSGKRKNVELFKRLDKRVMSSWEPQNALRPMPWSLPDLVPPSRQRKIDCYSLRDELVYSPSSSMGSIGSSASRYFTTTTR
jgi:meiosis-specific serine/threonine-protein kinase MEK1